MEVSRNKKVFISYIFLFLTTVITDLLRSHADWFVTIFFLVETLLVCLVITSKLNKNNFIKIFITLSILSIVANEFQGYYGIYSLIFYLVVNFLVCIVLVNEFEKK